MIAGNVSISQTKTMESLTVTVTLSGAREAKVRMAVGLWLFRLAGKVVGCRVVIDVK